MDKTVMFVDDEKQILKALNRLFMDSEYETVFMESGEDALRYLEEHPVDLVISDIRMPGMSGFDLLKAIKERYPQIMRVALSGFTDSRNIYKALEENIAKMYMFKPWDNKELMNIVDRMFELEEVLRDHRILELINNLKDLPTIPELYVKIRNLIAEDADVDVIAAAVEADQASSSRILRIANSAFYGAKTGSIAQAIMYIGLINVKNIVLSNSVFQVKGKTGETVRKLWVNATLTNRFMTLFYQEILKKKVPNVFASAGLLHNLGMVVMMAQNGEGYEAMMESANGDGMALLDMERNQLGLTHQEIGGYLLNWWEIPLPIVEAALYHHNPMDPRVINRELVHVVHLSNYFAWKRIGDTSFVPPLCVESYIELGVNRGDVDAFFDEIEVALNLFE